MTDREYLELAAKAAGYVHTDLRSIMNERIFTELYKKAWGHFPCPTGEPELEKFAALIVRECIREIGYKSVDLLDIDFYPHYQERLKKHFGVEE